MTTQGYVSQVRRGLLGWLESVRWKDQGWGRWKYNARMVRPYGLISSTGGIRLLDDLGELGGVSVQDKQQAVAFLQGCQDPSDGHFKDPLLTEADRRGPHSWDDIYGQMSGAADALHVLGARPLYPLPAARFVDLTRQDGVAWMRELPWENPWHIGERWSRAIVAYADGLPPAQAAASDPRLLAMFAEMESAILDPSTGMPTGKGCKDPAVAMAGLFKIMFGYLHVGRTIPNAERAIDSTLNLQTPSGEFGCGRDMCINWDALWVLRELDKQTQGAHRHADIAAAGNRLAGVLLRTYRKSDGGFAFHGDLCLGMHHSIYLSERFPIGDMLGARMCLFCLQYADEWNG